MAGLVFGSVVAIVSKNPSAFCLDLSSSSTAMFEMDSIDGENPSGSAQIINVCERLRS
jgi:hypothetical protein